MLISRSETSSSVPGLATNRKARSSTSSVRIGASLHGQLRTCKVCRGSWPSTHYMSGRMLSR